MQRYSKIEKKANNRYFFLNVLIQRKRPFLCKKRTRTVFDIKNNNRLFFFLSLCCVFFDKFLLQIVRHKLVACELGCERSAAACQAAQ